MKRIDIAGVEDDASPPRPGSARWLDNEVEIVRSRPKTGEGRVFTAMQNLKSQCPIEPDRAWHLVVGQCNRADTLDHRLNSPVSSASLDRTPGATFDRGPGRMAIPSASSARRCPARRVAKLQAASSPGESSMPPGAAPPGPYRLAPHSPAPSLRSLPKLLPGVLRRRPARCPGAANAGPDPRRPSFSRTELSRIRITVGFGGHRDASCPHARLRSALLGLMASAAMH